MASVPPQDLPSPQSRHGIHRPASRQTAQLVMLIGSQRELVEQVEGAALRVGGIGHGLSP